MLFAFTYQLLKQHKVIDDSNHGSLFSKRITITATLAAIVSLAVWVGFAFNCRNKPECTEIHPYIFFVPIVAFVTLRNISGLIRSRYSAFFSWFGRISLEVSHRTCVFNCSNFHLSPSCSLVSTTSGWQPTHTAF